MCLFFLSLHWCPPLHHHHHLIAAKTTLIPPSEYEIILFQSTTFCNKIMCIDLNTDSIKFRHVSECILKEFMLDIIFNFLAEEALRFTIISFTTISLKHCYWVWPMMLKISERSRTNKAVTSRMYSKSRSYPIYTFPMPYSISLTQTCGLILYSWVSVWVIYVIVSSSSVTYCLGICSFS